MHLSAINHDQMNDSNLTQLTIDNHGISALHLYT